MSSKKIKIKEISETSAKVNGSIEEVYSKRKIVKFPEFLSPYYKLKYFSKKNNWWKRLELSVYYHLVLPKRTFCNIKMSNVSTLIKDILFKGRSRTIKFDSDTFRAIRAIKSKNLLPIVHAEKARKKEGEDNLAYFVNYQNGVSKKTELREI